MFKLYFLSTKFIFSCTFLVLSFLLINPIKVDASHRYTATSGTLVVGTEAAINSGSTSGNVGSWYGTVGLDSVSPGYNWSVNSDGTNGLFVKELFALTPGVHHVEIYSTDPLNNVSNTINIPALLLPKQTTVFTNIFLPPTISINQNYFVENEIIEISGYTYPNAVLQITIIGDSFYRYTINADENGNYIISLPSSNFPNLNYSTYANLFINGIIDNSTQSQVLFFTINGVYITPSVTITPSVSITTSPGFTVTIEYPSDTPDITFEPSIITYIPTQKPTEYPTITPTIAVQPIISYELFLRCLYISIPLGIFTYFIFFILKQSKKAQIYILSGPGKTGTSYISHRILKDNKFEFLYIGSILKQKSIQAGFVKSGYKIPEDPDDFDLDKADIKGFRDNCVLIGRDVDKELDSYMIKRIIKAIDDKSKILIDSKILPLFMFSNSFKKFLLEELTSQNKADLFESYYNFIFENSKAVWLHTNLEVRAKRSLLKTLSKENLTEDLIRNEMLNLSKRQIADRQDYIRRYNLVDYPEPNKLPTNFKGTIIDSTELNGEETYKLVKKAFKLKDS